MGAPIATTFSLPFPPASLSGHNNGRWQSKSGPVKVHRAIAKLATLEACVAVPDEGDIPITMTFHPPDKRGDRVNFPNRAKPLWDGIADALGVNDSRFLPTYVFGDPVKGGQVLVTL